MPKLQEVGSLRGHEDRVWAADWHPQGDCIASCGGDRTVRVWKRFESVGDVEGAWVLVATLTGDHQRTIRSVAWSPDGQLLVCGSFDATITVYARDAEGRFSAAHTLEGHEHEVKGVAWNNEGRLLATCSRDKSVWIWERGPDGDFEMAALLHGHQQDVKCVAWHPFEQVLVSASYDDTLREWREEDAGADEWICSDVLTAHTSTVWAVAFERFPADTDADSPAPGRDPSNPRMVSCSDDATVIVWERTPSKEPAGPKGPKWRVGCTLSGYHERSVYSVDWSANNLIASAGGDDRINIFGADARDGTPATSSWSRTCVKEKAHASDVNCVRWNPNATRFPNVLLSCGDDGLVKIWRVDP
jgi:WD40 repeat protein